MNHSGKKFCLTVEQTHPLLLSTHFNIAKFTLTKFKTLGQFNLERARVSETLISIAKILRPV